MGWLGDAAKGALGGATAGAAIGGPLGAAIGGVGGGLLGGFGSQFSGDPAGAEQNRLLQALAEEAAGRGNPQSAAYSDFRGDQKAHLERVKALAEGRGPSLATEMLRQNTSNAQNNMFAQAAGSRGNGALAARSAINAGAGLAGQAAGQAAQARAAEQLGAIQQYGLGVYGARGQDEQTNQFNSRMALEALANNDRTRLAALSGSTQAAQIAGQAPTWGDNLTAMGAGLGQVYALANQSNGSKMSPIAGGNPGAGGFYSPTPNQTSQQYGVPNAGSLTPKLF